jgi:hypothetical protein
VLVVVIRLVSPALRRLREEDGNFEASLGYQSKTLSQKSKV